jgi:hypothetical protein
MATPTPDQLTKINQKALVPLTAENTFVFPAKVIGTKRIAKYLMKITPNFLNKMADQLKAGVALLIDHPWTKFLGTAAIPYGRTFDSRIAHENGEMELYADHYMVRGQELNGISTDDLASGIDGGTIFDTSAGFISTKHKCNVCDENYYSSDCEHFRGRLYDGKECLVLADDGYIMENSIVFDGGYDGAGVVKNNLSVKPNKEDGEVELQLEPLSLDAKSLSGDGRVFYFFSNTSGLSAFVSKEQKNEEVNILAEGDETVTDAEKAAALAAQQNLSALTAANVLLGQVRTALGVDADSGILAKLSTLGSQATDGAAYKLKLVEEACGAGVRALGDAFSPEAMKLSFNHLAVGEIEKVRDSYNAQALKALGGGGQHTQGADATLPDGTPSNPQANAVAKTPEELQAAAREEARAALTNTGHSSIMKEAK